MLVDPAKWQGLSIKEVALSFVNTGHRETRETPEPEPELDFGKFSAWAAESGPESHRKKISSFEDHADPS